MDNSNSSRTLYTHATMTLILGLTVIIMRIVIFYTVFSYSAVVWLQLIMGISCFVSSYLSWQAGKQCSSTTARRYSLWSVINLVIWTILGVLTIFLQMFALNYLQSSSFIVAVLWFITYAIGNMLLMSFWRFAKLYYYSFGRSDANYGRINQEGNEESVPIQPMFYGPGIYKGQPVDTGVFMPGQPMPVGGYAVGQPYYFGNQGNYANPDIQPITPVLSQPFNPDQPPPAREY